MIYYPAGTADNEHGEPGSVCSFFKLFAHEWHLYPLTHYPDSPTGILSGSYQESLRGLNKDSNGGKPKEPALYAHREIAACFLNAGKPWRRRLELEGLRGCQVPKGWRRGNCPRSPRFPYFLGCSLNPPEHFKNTVKVAFTCSSVF